MSVVLPTYRQSTQEDDGSSNPWNVAFTSSVLSGSLLVAVMRMGDNSPGATFTITDTVGTSYTTHVTGVNDTVYHVIAYGFAPSGGANSITMNTTTAAPGGQQFAIHEFTGLSGFDNWTSRNVDSGTSATSGSLATAQRYELLFGTFGGDGGASSVTEGAGWSPCEKVSVAAGFRLCTEYQVVTSAGSYAATGTLGSSLNLIASIHGFISADQGAISLQKREFRPRLTVPGIAR